MKISKTQKNSQKIPLDLMTKPENRIQAAAVNESINLKMSFF